MEADVGDTIVIHTTNNLGNETTGIHWHGQFQVGSNNMDGPVGVTQCAIPPGSSFTYSFVANPAGSFWYHSHASGQVSGLAVKLIARGLTEKVVPRWTPWSFNYPRQEMGGQLES